LSPLPIDPLLPEIIAALRGARAVIVQASPGAGKTTRVPGALLDAGLADVLVLEPRRLAARMAARRVASERGERVGETVGYQVRFEEAAGPRTRLRFLTEGVLTRRLLHDPLLRGVSAVVLDEFHERHLEGDLALALLRRLQRTGRRDLKFVVMSATLDAGPIAKYLGGCPVLTSEDRRRPLEIRYTPHLAQPLEQQVAGAFEDLARRGTGGHVLVFLPGAAEIRRAARACEPAAQRYGFGVFPLHGDLPPGEQDRAVEPSHKPKLILSTNVAESSITIDGVTAVIDSGVARVARQSPWSGLPLLEIARVSQASADQRAGRAGRTGPGTVIRLYPLDDFARRPRQDKPEILRAELSSMLLHLRAMGIDAAELEWLDGPPPEALAAASELLARLAADGEAARAMARLPLHPRLARLVIEAAARKVPDDGFAVAAVLSAGERLPEAPEHVTRSDLLYLAEQEPRPRTAQVLRQIRRALGAPRQSGHDEDALLLAILAAFPDRAARRRSGDQLLLSTGASARLSRNSTVQQAPFLVAVDVEERTEQGMPIVRLASAAEPEWLVELYPGRIRQVSETQWDRAAGRVEQVTRLLYDELVLEETRRAPASDEAAALLAQKAGRGRPRPLLRSPGAGAILRAPRVCRTALRTGAASPGCRLPRACATGAWPHQSRRSRALFGKWRPFARA
jgi:ATP-dependent helicase HrpB